MPFLARPLKKTIFFDVDTVVKKQIETWFIMVYTLIANEYTLLLFSQTFFLIASAFWASLKKFLKGKSDMYK